MIWLQFATFFLSYTVSALITTVRYSDFVKTLTINPTINGVTLVLKSLNQTFTLNLYENKHLIMQDTLIEVYNRDGNISRISPGIPFVFRGTCTRDTKDIGWARITFHSNPYFGKTELVYDGSFESDGILYHVSTIDSYRASKTENDIAIVSPLSRDIQHRAAKMIMYKDDQSEFYHNSLYSRSMGSSMSCGVDSSRMIRRKSQPLESRQVLDACNSTRKVLPMGLVSDCTYTRKFADQATITMHLLSVWNQASQLYEDTFGITLAIITIKILESCGDINAESLPFNKECSNSYDLSNRLSDFSLWRGKKEKDKAGLWHLKSSCNSGTTIGLAWTGTLCVTKSSSQMDTNTGELQYTAGTAVSTKTTTEWKVVAHEIGHSLL